jgi:hypothetical protein
LAKGDLMIAKEHEEQKALVKWLRYKGIGFFSVPNGFIAGGKNKWAMINKLKAEGMTKGAPDLVLKQRTKDGRPIAIEMKRQKDGRLSDEQRDMAGDLTAAGWVVLQPKGAMDAIVQIEEIL